MTLSGKVRCAHHKTGAHSAPAAPVLLFAVGLAHAAPDPEKRYETHCLSCHAPNRLGGMGPTSLPDSLARLKQPIVYDAKLLKEIKHLPMKRSVGKYNVWNKTRLSEGTSH